MPDHDGYPTEDELERIEKWDLVDGDIEELLAFVKSLWWAADWGWTRTQRRLYLSTGGWSGNEDIITAMQHNFIFWSMCWVSHRRGGHYEFEVNRQKRIVSQPRKTSQIA